MIKWEGFTCQSILHLCLLAINLLKLTKYTLNLLKLTKYTLLQMLVSTWQAFAGLVRNNLVLDTRMPKNRQLGPMMPLALWMKLIKMSLKTLLALWISSLLLTSHLVCLLLSSKT